MNKFSKQFAIINKIKEFVASKKHKEPRKPSESVSEKLASKIQDSAYKLCKNVRHKETATPPYKVLAEQLDVSDNQIYFAAVYTLVRIGVNEKEHKDAILNILRKTYDTNKSNRDREKYLSAKISELNAG